MKRPETVLVYSGLELIGDGLMKLPFLRALRHAFPDAHITWVAGIGRSVYNSSLARLVAPYLDEVIEDAGIGRSWNELARRPLAPRQFDLVIDTQRRVKTTAILRRIRHRRFVSGTMRFLLSDAKPPGSAAKKRRLHDSLLDLVAAASGRPAVTEGAATIDPEYASLAAAALPTGPRYVGLAPGAGGHHKRWPRERFAALAQRLAGHGFVPVFILGPDEAAWHAELARELPDALFPHATAEGDPALAASPLFTIALAARLSAAVANDSGTGHMLAAADVPLVSLFGPTDPAKFAPHVTFGLVVNARGRGDGSMEAIPVEEVEAAILRLIAQSTSR